MTKQITFLPSATATWSTIELQRLRTLARDGESVSDIAKALKRSASSIKNKASLHGIPLSGFRAGSRPGGA